MLIVNFPRPARRIRRRVSALAALAVVLASAACSGGSDGPGSGASSGPSAAAPTSAATGSAATTTSGSTAATSSGGEGGSGASVARFCEVYADTEQARLASVGNLKKVLPVYRRLAAVAPPQIKSSVDAVVDGIRRAKGDEIPNAQRVFAEQQKVARFTLSHCA